MKKYFIALVVLLAASVQGMAQQQPLFTQYMYNGLAYNPAYAGSREAFSGLALFRRQWLNIEGSPLTYNFSAHTPLGNQKNAVGLNLQHDQLGIMRDLSATAAYAYRIQAKTYTISLGLQASINQFTANYSQVRLTSQQLGGPADAAFAGQDANLMLPNFGVGAYWYSNTYFLGLSVPQIIEHKPTASNGAVLVETKRHMYLAGAYVFPIDRTWQIKPGGLVRAVAGAPLQVDINGTLIYKNTLFMGLSVRNWEAVAPMVQVKLTPSLYAGYAFDFATTRLANYSHGTHEIFVGFDFNLTRPVVISPRYF